MSVDPVGTPSIAPWSNLLSSLTDAKAADAYTRLQGANPQEKAQFANAAAIQCLNWAQEAVARLKAAEGKVAELQASGGAGLPEAQEALRVARINANTTVSNSYDADILANYAAQAASLSEVPYSNVSSVHPDIFATASAEQFQGALKSLQSAPIGAPSYRVGAAGVLGTFVHGSPSSQGFSYVQDSQRAAQIAAMSPEQLAKMPQTFLVDNAGLIPSNSTALPLDSTIRNNLQNALAAGGDANSPFFVKDGSVAAWGLGLGNGGPEAAGNKRSEVEAYAAAHGYTHDDKLGGWTSAGGKFEAVRRPDPNINYTARGGIWGDSSSGIKMRYFNPTELSGLNLSMDVSQGGKVFFVPPDPTKPDQGQRFYLQRNDNQPAVDITAVINPNTRAALATHFEKAPITNYGTDLAKSLKTGPVNVDPTSGLQVGALQTNVVGRGSFEVRPTANGGVDLQQPNGQVLSYRSLSELNAAKNQLQFKRNPSASDTQLLAQLTDLSTHYPGTPAGANTDRTYKIAPAANGGASVTLPSGEVVPFASVTAMMSERDRLRTIIPPQPQRYAIIQDAVENYPGQRNSNYFASMARTSYGYNRTSDGGIDIYRTDTGEALHYASRAEILSIITQLQGVKTPTPRDTWLLDTLTNVSKNYPAT